jgi:competence protein ComEA
MRISLLSFLVLGVALLGAAPVAAQTPVAAPAARTVPAAPAIATAPAQKTLNLNTATIEQLETLPGIGRKTAQLIVEYRAKVGSFKKVEELMNIKGIGEKSFLKLKPLVSAPARPEKAPGA